MKNILIALVVSASLYAEDLYVSQSGSGDGTSCSSPRSAAWFNTAANWGGGAGEIDPGDTVHLCGTFTATANTTMLTVQASGSSGQSVTILFEADAKLTSPSWANTGAINLNGKSYLIVDGGSNGTIENTDNGSALGNQRSSRMVYSNTGSNVEVRNLTLTNNYVRVVNSSDQAAADAAVAVLFSDIGSNIYVHHNTMTNCGGACVGIDGASSNPQNWRISHNTAQQAKWLLNASNTRSQTHYIYIHDNDIADTNNYWDSNNYFHCNGIFVFGNPATPPQDGTYGYLYIYNNYIHGSIGNANQTGAIFLSKTSDGPSYIFNNVIRPTGDTAGSQCFGSGVIALQWDQINAVSIYNNTIDSTVACGYSHGTGSRVSITNATPLNFKNNIVHNNGGFHILSGSATSDYNIWYGIGSAAQQAFRDAVNWWYYSSAQGTPNWVTATGNDTHSITSDPQLGALGVLTTGSPAIGAGTNLASVCESDSNLAPLCSDKAGVARGASWDIGAYEYQSEAGGTRNTLRGHTLRGSTIR